MTFRVAFPGGNIGQHFDTLIYATHRVDMKLAVFDGLDNIRSEH